MNPIDPSGPARIRREEEDPYEARERPATTPKTSTAELPLHALPDALSATPHGRRFLDATTLVKDAPPEKQHTERVQRGLDAFRMKMTGWYRTPSGPVAVPTPFYMVPKDQRKDPTKIRVTPEQLSLGAQAGLSPAAASRVFQGRGTPEEIHRVTQLLIDRQPPRASTPLEVRKLMFAHKIGTDCAGYVQQAYLAASGQSRAQAGFQSIENESLSALPPRGFSRVDRLSDVRAGDVVVFPGATPAETGHRGIVFAQRVATVQDMEKLRQCGVTGFDAGGPVRVLEVDSSWGSGDTSDWGGSQRRTFWFNDTTRQWATERPHPDGTTHATVSGAPYDHEGTVIYRGKDR